MASPSSPVASSSTISASVLPLPQPGKSILKKPPPPQARFFSISTFSKLLPTPTVPSSSNQNAPPLRRAHFILPKLQTVYSISTANPPSSPSSTEERKLAEQREAERRRTVVRGNSYTQDQDAWWSSEKVETFYRECCRGREEDPLSAISTALKVRTSLDS
jgi:protein phosphatase 1 regulatory subunit 37